MSLQREIDRLFDDFTRGFPSLSNGVVAEALPNMGVTETDKQIEITYTRSRGKGRAGQRCR